MKNLTNMLFPIRIHLTVLQLEEYNIQRYLSWIFNNIFKRYLYQKRGLVITQKIKLILFVSVLLFFLIIIFLFILNATLLLIILVTLTLSTQPFILFSLVTMMIRPFEELYSQYLRYNTKRKILSNRKLKVIAITGSYAKTSVKEYLYQIINSNSNTLRTPESYNTTLGIAKVVDYELDDKYNYFICELGAYKRGDIKKLCTMTEPKYAIITGVTYQHLERFGSLKNTIDTKFEIYDFINKKTNIALNIDDKNIKQEAGKRGIKNTPTYSADNNKADVYAKNIKFNPDGSKFTLVIKNNSYKIATNLFGLSNINSALAAATAAYAFFGMKPKYIAQKVANLQTYHNRFKLVKSGGSNIVDNTFSSNVHSFLTTIKTAKLLRGNKAMVTPGLVELGNQSEDIHRDLGLKSSGIFDYFVLVGKNDRTKSFAKGLRKKDKVIYIKDEREDYFEMINSLKNKYKWIFLENDLTENY